LQRWFHAPAGAVSPNSVSLAWIEATDRFSFRLITGTGTPSRANSLSCWTASRVQGRSAVGSMSLMITSLLS
jgi:hypothetical protein